MKIAVTGKGGVGKSTISGTMARHLAVGGHRVVALDADPNPNLGVSLGFQHDAVEHIEPILNALLASGHTHDMPEPAAEDLLDRYGIAGPDGVVLVATGKIERPSDACLCCGSHSTTRSFFGDLDAKERVVIADLEAGLNDLIWAQPGPDDVVVVVADPSAKAVEVARRAVELAGRMGVERILGVANRAESGDADRLAAVLGVEVVAVPLDPAIESADRTGEAPFDLDRSSPAVAAIAALADRLVAVQPAGA